MIHLTSENYNSRDIIKNIFSPLVGVLSSSQADEICHKNNLSIVELLQPFSKFPSDVHFRDVSGTNVSIRGFRMNFCDVEWRPPQTVLARKMLNEAVVNAHNDKTKTVTIGNVELELPTAEPWFEKWRETFLTVQFPSDHEFTRHLLSCLLFLSSTDPNIIETAHKLTQRVQQMQSITPQKLPKWFHPNDVLNSYVVLHESSQGDLSKCQQGFEMLKSTFGDNNCFLLSINSLADGATSDVPDYWSPYVKRQLKADAPSAEISASKTPQDAVSVISMPNIQMSTLIDATSVNECDMSMLHPLSPMQENATEAINSKFSASSESITSQTINPNVWAHELDEDAPLGCCLNAPDVENLRHFVQDYSIRAFMPYVERLVVALNEAVTNKKGVSKSILSATKRWFVTSKPGAGVNNQNAVIYTNESGELQTRKLGDLYFMFGHYNLAFQAYHQAKRDFNADSAWQYYAGALEMAALSAFMLGTANRKTYDYMEDAIVCYLTVCKLQQFATRATLLSMECLKTARQYSEVAKQLIRMTSEESDLRSALLLEQAAYCFLVTHPPMHRKYAFQIVLAGNRYSRAGQRKHAYRCYRQAYQVFQGRGWSLAEDHVQYTIAKQAYMLKKLEEASNSFAHLLRPCSLQSAQQQTSFLKEYIQTQNELIKRSPEFGILPHALPQVLQDSVRVLTMVNPSIALPQHISACDIDIKSDLLDEPNWQKLEEMIVISAASNKPFVFKPSRYLFTKEHPAADVPLAVQGEPIELSLALSNSVRCSITVTNINLLWKLSLENEETLSNDCLFEQSGNIPNAAAVNAAIKTNCLESVVLEERNTETLNFKITPKLTGRLNIIGIVCRVAATAEPNASLLGSLHFEAQRMKPSTAKQLKPTQQQMDNRLSVQIVPQVPSLGVSFSFVPTNLLAGEIVPVSISLRNLGITPIGSVYMACETPRWISLLDRECEIPLSILSSIKDISNDKLVKDKEIRRLHVFRLLQKKSDAVALKAQEGANIPLWLQAPYKSGPFTLRLLFYYAFPGSSNSQLKYRLVRHTWHFNIHDGLSSEATCVISNNVSNELGIIVSLKNNNQHKQILSSEVYVNTLDLYSNEFKLNPKSLCIMNQMEVSEGQNGEACLKPTKSASFQCRLETKQEEKHSEESSLKKLLMDRITKIDIMPTKQFKKQQMQAPALTEPYSFLTNHETIYFNTNISTEEFNTIVSRYDSHMTLALSWTAVVQENSSETRNACGQHFMQLHKLYERSTCPPSGNDVDRENLRYRHNNGTLVNASEITSGLKPNEDDINTIISNEFSKQAHNSKSDHDTEDDDDEFWEPNEHYVSKRCFLEDEAFFISTAKV